MNRKNRKNKTNKIKRSIPAWKRVLSGIMVLVLMSGILPLEGIAPILKLTDVSLRVHAEDVHDVDNNPTIMYYEELVDYSKAYAAYPESHHENDTITIAITNGLSTDLINDFEGIGTATNPFAGKIVINSNSFDNFNIKRAFFNYVYDYVEIEAQGTKQFTINTSGDNSGAVFAEHVVHDTSSNITYDSDEAQNDPSKTLKTPASWNIQVEDYQGNPHTHSSLIGDMGENAEVTVSIVNNTTSSFSSSNGNVGTICGIMQTDSKLTVESVTGTNTAGVSATSGNAGGLVGEMASGSELIVKSFPNTAAITAGGSSNNKGYAGGLVGRNDRAFVTLESTAPAIQNTVTGSSGAGGLYGYYKPVMTNSAYSLSLDDFSIGTDGNNRCTVSSSGGAGGFFGVLDNPGGTITLSGSDDSTIFVRGDGASTVFGGIIGKYQATGISDTLKIQGVAASPITVNATKTSADTTAYGGIIGKVDGACFVSITDADVTAANSGDWTFGGAVGIADTGYTYVKDFKLNTSNSEAHGGGVVGSCANGVVHLSGATDISGAKIEAGSSSYGQIVGYRDSALVFADSSWDFTRNGTANSVDDIGSWGEVVRFKASGYTIYSVLDNYYDPTQYPTTHYAKLKGATISNDIISISSKSTFATAALNMQLNGGSSSTSNVLQFTDTTNSTYTALKAKSVSMTANVDLNNTGMTGLTRDNKHASWTSGIGPEYSGSEFDGNSHTLTLAIGAGYEGTDSSVLNDASGKGKIYTHRFNGLFGETSSAFTVKDVTITGKVHTYDRAGKDAVFYVGTVAGNAAAAFNAAGVTVNNNTSIVYGTDSDDDEEYVGGLVGKMSAPGTSKIGTQTGYAGTTNCTFSAAITGNAAKGTPFIGGISGYVDGGTVSVYDVKISGSVTNSGTRKGQYIGGLFANVKNCTLVLNGIELNGLTVKGKMNSESGATMGGLLGYNYFNTTATFDNIKVLNCTIDNDSSTGRMAGLVNMGSGYWIFQKVEIGGDSPSVNGITLSGSSAESFGMLVNRASSGDSAMYLELPEGFVYKIYNVTGTAPAIYDEIAANTMLATSIEENGNPIVSINTNGTTRYGTMTASDDTNTDNTKVHMTSGKCNTYQNQVTTTGFSNYNPNSRYYYNVDNYIGKSNSGAAALYLWSVYKYAHSSIQTKIATTAPSSTFSGDLDLDGYSYYPVDVKSGTVNIKGSVGLHNKEIETMEGNEAAGKGDNYSRTTLSGTQHYLMHAGLFRNVGGTININGALSISGTVPKINDYCGALICGTIGGSTTSDAIVKSNNTGASLSLDGIKVHNKDADYSPLLINKVGSYTILNIYNVSAVAAEYNTGANNTTEAAATSLIGDVGSETAQKVQLTFNNIKFDGRTSGNTAESNLDSVYGTTKSIFTKATLLNSLSYAPGTGSSGVYNYKYNEDWGTPGGRSVTYGSEISDSNSTNFKKEFWYFEEDHSSATANYTHALSGTYQGNTDTTAPYDFSGFIPYVYVSGTRISNSSTQHQLDVNHASATFGGCGTYNHPFIIAPTASDPSGGLETIEKIIANRGISGDTSIKLYLPDDITTPDRWCDNSKTDCEEYEFNGSDTFVYSADTSLNKSLTNVRTYLAGAYYYINGDITLSTNFQGLGSTSDDAAIFRGVIAGNNKTITNNSLAPLIASSNGSVVKNLTVKVVNTNLTVTGANSAFASTTGCGAYGAVIGKVFGGDNIIDKVGVQFDSTTKINPSGTTYLAPIGGFIGVVVDGGVIFKNMSEVSSANRTGLTDSNFKTTGKIGDNRTAFLYCNPIIGRILNGYAVNEASSYHAAEADVLLKNGTKNYSIADIKNGYVKKVDEVDCKLKIDNTNNTIDAYTEQDWFILSLIVNDGSSLYLGTNKAVHRGNYNDVNTTNASSTDYANDVTGTTGTPYIPANYTTNGAWTSNSTGYTITMHGGEWRLPDGYRGIGGINSSNSGHNINVAGITGNSTKIELNMKYQSYRYKNSHEDNYPPIDTGLGLFNEIKLSTNATVANLILKGNIFAEAYKKEDGSIPLDYGTSNSYYKEYAAYIYTPGHGLLHAGMLAGVKSNSSYRLTLDNISLVNISITTDRRAGGLLGDTDKITITNCSGNNVSVLGRWDTGGMLGNVSGESYIIGDSTDKTTFSINEVNQRGKGFKFYDNNRHSGVGGLIGQNTGTCTISNIILNKTTGSRGVVIYTNLDNSNDSSSTGGILGANYNGTITITNCDAGDINVKGSTNRTGGLIGASRGTNNSITITNVILDGTNSDGLESTGKECLGGMVGFAESDIYITDSAVQNYSFIKNATTSDSTSDYIGGCIGWINGKTLYLKNFTVLDCSFSGETVANEGYVGGLVGRTSGSIKGYNVVVKNITNSLVDTTKYRGDIVGKDEPTQVQVVGFSRQNTNSAKLINNKTTYTMSSSQYIIFTDYEGTGIDGTGNTLLPKKNDTDVTDMVTDISIKSPYVNVNPSLSVDDYHLLTGDGVSKSAVDSILADINAGSEAKRYQMAPTVSSSDISTFSEEFGDIIPNKSYADMPILIVNSDVDTKINNYIRLLTNNSSTFDYSYDGTKIGPSSGNSSNIGTVSISRCTYNTSTGKFDIVSDSSVNLKFANNEFAIRTDNSGKEQYDTAVPTGQFTLIDIAFKDPTVSSNKKVAYHLYVPVIVKKLVEYNFDISVLSGTTYDKTLYGTETNGVRGRALLENLGSPVTFEFDYKYLRTASEWAAEDKDYKYDKYLSFSNGGNYDFGSGTKAVLIDLNRGGVAYYLDNWASGFNSTTKLLNLQAFTNASGTSFTPMTFQEMITAQGASFTGDATLTESYYLTIYTPKYERGADDDSTQVAHYTVASETFTDSQHPSRRVDCETQTTRQPHNSVHLIIGDFYTNTLTVSTTNSNRMMSASNRQIGVNLSATIDVVNAETHQAIDQYLGYTDIKIYQSYLLAFEKYLVAGTKAETGISAIDDCSVDFTITRGTTNVNVTREAVVPSHNYVELQNNTDISSQLRLGAVVINASATMSFNNEETRNAQFPKATESDNGIGALVIGSSNISSQPENTAYSTASITRQDSNSRYYYRTNEQAAILNYHADYSGATKANQRGTQLGINARELEVDVPAKDAQTIYTEVRYDASGLLNADKIEYIKCVVKLYRKTGMTNNVPTYEAVPINQFLRDLTVNGTKTQEYTTFSSSDVASTEFAYVYSVSNVDQFTNEENVFKIPIVFDAISGNSTGFRDTDGYIYANYKVEVTVSAFDENHSTDATPWTSSMINSTPTPDYVIYTNARVFTDEYVTSN